MTYNDIRKNENKGFSLVELIVVVAIMAVLVAVLAPSLLAYVERSRAQKDDSAMGEVSNAIMLALADQNVYDEVLRYTCTHNSSCYKDGVNAGTTIITKDNNKDTDDAVTTKADGADQWMLDDGARLKDEVAYGFDGDMRGVTITFEPAKGTKKSTFTIAAGKLNVAKTTNSAYINGTAPGADYMTLETMSSVDAGTQHYLFNRVRATVGDKIELTSQTYRNSNYTVFIRMGTTGGNQASNQDAIKVYGQWNGTNLPKD
jgi:type IV pilus assembly protein PilA